MQHDSVFGFVSASKTGVPRLLHVLYKAASLFCGARDAFLPSPSLFIAVTAHCIASYPWLSAQVGKYCSKPSNFSIFIFTTLSHSSSVPISYSLVNMPTESPYPRIDVPNVGLWDFLFERKDKPYPDDHGWSRSNMWSCLIAF